MVDVLPSLLSLIVLALPLPTLVAATAAAGAVLFPRPTPALVLASARTLRVRVFLALSTMLVRIPAAPPDGTGAVGFKGETGRERRDFAGGA